MTSDIIIARVQRIEELVRDRRLDLARVLALGMEGDLREARLDGSEDRGPIRDQVQASRMFTGSLIRLRDLRVH